MNEPGGPMVVAVDEQRDFVIDTERWRALARAALRHEGLDAGELNLLFVGEAEMRGLNSLHMGEDRPTDVLSFPLDGAVGAAAGESLIGDIVLCPAYAARQAPAHAATGSHRGCLEDELALLVVHGVLHVLGFDHTGPTETDAMQARERDLLHRYHRDP